MHKGIARSFIDESNVMEKEGGESVSSDEELVIQRVLANKITRQGNFCEVNIFYIIYKNVNIDITISSVFVLLFFILKRI